MLDLTNALTLGRYTKGVQTLHQRCFYDGEQPRVASLYTSGKEMYLYPQNKNATVHKYNEDTEAS